VTLDGKKVSPVMLTPGFIGIKVDPGTHQATFSYQPPSYRFPLMVVGVLVLGILGFGILAPGKARFYREYCMGKIKGFFWNREYLQKK
ncbi:MAG: YfhO family protein, partial [Methanomicrobiales archaeon]|nr:YfhO family protein [Methanomicrobiales archaeon]